MSENIIYAYEAKLNEEKNLLNKKTKLIFKCHQNKSVLLRRDRKTENDVILEIPLYFKFLLTVEQFLYDFVVDSLAYQRIILLFFSLR